MTQTPRNLRPAKTDRPPRKYLVGQSYQGRVTHYVVRSLGADGVLEVHPACHAKTRKFRVTGFGVATCLQCAHRINDPIIQNRLLT